MTAITKVAIAVVESDGHFLVGVRPEGVPLSGQAEFPGGKLHPGESSRVCVVRECGEETGLVVIPKYPMTTATHAYEHGMVELSFWRCELAPDLPDRAKPSGTFRWVARTDLANLNFPEANAEVIAQLAADT